MESGRLISPQIFGAMTHGVRCVALSVLLVSQVPAQDIDRYETVQNRSRPELDALGMRLGALKLFPAVELEYRDVDNIFADDTNEQDDTIVLVNPQVRLQSGWSRHQLRLGADLLVARYSDFDNEDYDDLRVWGDGRLDLGNGRITLIARHADLHQDRSSPDDERSIEPVEFSADSVELTYRFEAGANFAEAGIEADLLDFEDAMRFGGGVDENDDRDRDRLELKLRVGRKLSEEYSGFVEVQTEEIEYDQEFDEDGFQRSSDTYELFAGTSVDLSGRVFGEVYVGYRDRDYDDPRFENADGVAFGADVTWNLTGLTTLNFSGSSEIDSTTIVGASGIEVTRLGLTVDHELLRNLIISLTAAATSEDFEGLDRDDDIQRYAAQARYMMNRNLYVTAGVEHRKRDTSGLNSSPDQDEYTINKLFIQVRGQL